VVAVFLALAVIMVISFFYQELLYQTFDAESARTSGIRTGFLDAVLAVLTSITVVIGMKVVGILLVAALLVIPSAAGLQIAKTFRQAVIISSGVSIGSVIAGLFMAYYWDLPAAGTTVIISFLVFLAFGTVRILRKRGVLD
jgi:zinc transport system permease protein